MGRAALDRILEAHAEARGREPCGLLLGTRDRGGRRLSVAEAVTVENVHPSPGAGWRMAPEAQLEASRDGRGRGLEIVGTWHGHLASPPIPGRADAEGYREARIPGTPPRVLVIVGKGSGPFPLVRAWQGAKGALRELPIKT